MDAVLGVPLPSAALLPRLLPGPALRLRMSGLRQWLNGSVPYKWARRIAISIIGGTVLLVGLAMVVLPGPALIVIPIGLGILGLEFAWARRWLTRVKTAATDLVDGARNGVWRKPKEPIDPSRPR